MSRIPHMARNKRAYRGGNPPHINGYPGPNFHYVLCDICGRKLRARDAILVNDKYNYQNNMLVCPEDVDEVNPQIYIRAKRERHIENPRLIRPEPEHEFVFIDSASEIESGDTSNESGDTPGAPRYLSILSVSSDEIELQWVGPIDSGGSGISGHKIERESPVDGGFSTLVSDTESVAGYYKDTGLTASTTYNYRVTAINRNGAGTASNEANATTSAS